MRSMLRLTGDTEFSFETSSAAYQRYVSTRGSRWPEQERLGRAPALRHVGITAAEITLDGVIYPGIIGGLQEDMRKLRELSLAEKPFQMVTGTGQICGFWAVIDVSDTRTVFMDNGLPRKVEFTLKLKYYGTDYQGSEGNVGMLPASPLASLTENLAALPPTAGLESLPVLDTASTLDDIIAVSNTVNGILETVTATANKALHYAADPLALVSMVSDHVPVECLNGAKETARAAHSVLDVGQRVFDVVSAVTALPYTLTGADPEKLNAVTATLRQNLLYTRDTARLAIYGMDTVQRGLATTGHTLSRLPERLDSAALCLEVSGQAGTMLGACRRLDEDTSIILEKFR
jgi:phage protein U